MAMLLGRSGRLTAMAMIIACVPAGAVLAQAGDGGDPVAGKAVSAKCLACHSFAAGQNKMGPSLSGVVGRKAGTEAGFTYSTAMADSKLTWDRATLDRYLTNPRAVVPGTKMIFPGIPNATDRANLIAFLAGGSGSATGK